MEFHLTSSYTLFHMPMNYQDKTREELISALEESQKKYDSLKSEFDKGLEAKEKEKLLLEKLNNTSDELIKFTEITIDYHKILQTILDISGAKYAAFNIFDDNGNGFTTVAIAGIEQNIHQGLSTLGIELINKHWPLNRALTEAGKSKLFTRFEDLHELTAGALPQETLLQIEATFSLGATFVVNIARDNKILGNFILLFTEQETLVNHKFVDLYVHQVGMFLDRDKALRNLQISEAKHNSMISNISDVIGIIDTHGTIVYESPNIEHWFGWQAQELIGTNCWNMVHPEDIDRVQTGCSILLITANATKTIDFRYRCRAGHYRWVKLTATNLINDPAIHGILLNYHDNTESIEAETALRVSEERMSQLVSNMQVGVLMKGPQGEIILSNPKTLELLGVSEEQLSGQIPFDSEWNVIHEDGSPFPESDQPISQALITKKAVNNIVMGVYRPLTMDRVWLLVDAEPKLNKDETIRKVVCTYIDITKLKHAEEKVLKLYLAVEQSTASVVITDIKGTIEYVNPKFCDISGYSKEECIGQNPRILRSGDTSSETIKDLWKTVLSGKAWHGEMINKRKNGELYWESTAISPVINNNVITHFIAIKEDIIERKRAEEALEQSHRLNKTLLQTIPFGMDIVDEHGEILFQNDNLKQIFNQKSTSDKCWSQYHTNGSEQVECSLHANIEIGVTKTHPSHAIFGGKDYEIIHTGLIFDDKKALLEIFIDITDRKRVEEALKESELRFSEMATNSSGVIFQFYAQPDGVTGFHYISPKAVEIFGFSTDPNSPDWDLAERVHPEDKKLFLASRDEAIAKPKEWDFEGRLLTKKGVRWIHCLSHPTIKNEEIVFNGIIMDITERKQAQENLLNYTTQIELNNLELDTALYSAEQATAHANEMMAQAEMANKSKSIFLANMSHEIRTPLNAIIGFSQLMNRDPLLTIGQREYNISIIRAGEHLLTLINDILELSKIEAGAGLLNPTEVNLHHFFEDIQMIFKDRAKSKHLQFIFETADDLPQCVILDESKLRQIFMNLISNAIKFTDEGGIAVRVRVDVLDEENTNMTFEVQDTGAGISEIELGFLFKHFVQTSSGIKKGSGTGLGLALSRELANLMGGNITVTSKEGIGSVFTCTVKIKEGSKEAVKAIITERVIGIEKGQEPFRILVVDDKEENLKVAVTLLKIVGFETNEAVNGVDAIEKFESWSPSLILMDLRMPVMDGYEATHKIKMTPKGQKTPIIALTASSFGQERSKVESLEIQGFVQKPFRDNELFSAIGNLLNIKYIYDDKAESPYEQEKYVMDDSIIAKDIADLSKPMIHELLEAIAVADLDLIMELIKNLPPTKAELALYLTSLANNYDYAHLEQLLKGENNNDE